MAQATKAAFIDSCLFSVVLLLLFWIYSYPIAAISYVLLLGCALSSFLLGLDFFIYYKGIKAFQNISIISPIHLPKTTELGQLEYQNMIRRLESQNRELDARYQRLVREANDYYTLWSHQIKTPLSAVMLLLQQDTLDLSTLRLELFKIEQYVDMALGYQRLNSIESDFDFQEHSLVMMVRQAVRNLSSFFIYQKITLDIGNLDRTLVTDKKWFIFVLEQILSNSLKYAPEGKISIYIENDFLVIEDNGIGINEEYLPRIFERGFTGSVGRINQHSTGIGLYLCRNILEKIALTISICSQKSVGTKVYISIKQKHFAV